MGSIAKLILLLLIAQSASSQCIKRRIVAGTGYPEANGLAVAFLEHIPPPNPSGRLPPLIIFLHGAGEKGPAGDTTTSAGVQKLFTTGIPANLQYNPTPYFKFPNGIDTTRYAMLAPQCASSFGAWPIMYTREMIKYAETHLVGKVDLKRIYVTGLSLGGYGTWIVARDSLCAVKVSAGAAICPGGWAAGASFAATARFSFPIAAFHAVNDPTADIINSRNFITSYNTNFPLGTVQYFEFSGNTPGTSGHNIWGVIYNYTKGSYQLSNGHYWDENEFGTIYEWFLNFHTESPRRPPGY